ncbi:MAG: sugar phosphate nucleotidyltransferase [Bacteroidota bacterium]|nr:sugar phosphate nucleotidyltransferase [Candidatus Kapabacteria bacterium]MDW8221047.1 sugar phosphate nucleotidyltransferase [Bacteroidota bacterium]
MQRTALIMAGGSGERFWPLSRRTKPKQLLNLISPDKTMLDEAIERIAPLISPDHIFIITNEALQPIMREHLSLLPPANIIAEPLKRNTAPCIALGSAFIAERYPSLKPHEISIAVLTADHFIESPERFRAAVDAALTHAEKTGDIVTFGIRPTRPATGYGYIEVAASYASAAIHPLEAIPVASFHEKPSLETAQEFLRQGRFFWNSGMFFWRLDTIISGLERHLPDVGRKIRDLRAVLTHTTQHIMSASPPGTYDIFKSMPDISIDYGLMERAHHVAVVCADFGWDDVGSWDALERVYEPDEAGNINVGGSLLLDSKNCIVMNSVGDDVLSVAAIGVENLVIVATKDGILVCPKDRVQDVRRVVSALREQSGEKFV